MPFKFDSHKFYLTYAQCGDLDWVTIADVLKSKADIKWARFGHEQHEDGGWHWHVCGEWTRRVQSRSERFLDVSGFHPNIQSTRSTSAVVAYVSKHGQFHDIGDVPANESKRTVSEALALAGSANEQEYLRACIEAKISYCMAKRYRELELQPTCPHTILEYEPPDIELIKEPLRYQPIPSNSCAVVVGPTAIGKTLWAKWICPKPALFVSHLETLKAYRPGYHRTLIFDDLTWKWMDCQRQIALLDWYDPRSIRVMYQTVTIPAHTYKIFTCNCWPFSTAEDKPLETWSLQAIERRVTKIQVRE